MVETEFLSRVRGLVENWLPARVIVRDAITNRHLVHPSGLIINLTQQLCPWKAHFFAIEKELIASGALRVNCGETSGQVYKERPVFVLTERNPEFGVLAIPCSPDAPFSKRFGNLLDCGRCTPMQIHIRFLRNNH